VAKKFNPTVASALGTYSDADIFDRLQRIRQGAQAQSSTNAQRCSAGWSSGLWAG
jgi:hypothetical protein